MVLKLIPGKAKNLLALMVGLKTLERQKALAALKPLAPKRLKW